MSFDTIDLLTGHVFQVTWDTGRRCNYDCSYCPMHRHDNFSPHATLDNLKDNVDFLYEYIDLHLGYRTSKIANIGFTGGGAGSGMIYRLGKTDHKLDNDKMIDHIVGLVETRAKELSEK